MREKILRFVLGDRLIHIQYLSATSFAKWLGSDSNDSNDSKNESSKGRLCSAFCVAEKTEQEAYDEVNHSFRKAQAINDPSHIATCKDRHKDCLTCGFTDWQLPIEKLQGERLTFDNNLSVLAVSRQLYEESNNILWQTNVFSFDRSECFIIFIRSMNLAQKRKLKKIHLRLDVAIDTKFVAWGYWPQAIAQRVLTPLKNLKVVHLSIDQFCVWDTPLISTTSPQLRVGEFMDRMLGLRLLPWKNKENPNQGKHVTVVISDDASTHSGNATPHWTQTQKLEAAEEFRLRLAAPNSAEIHTAERKAMEEEEEEEE